MSTTQQENNTQTLSTTSPANPAERRRRKRVRVSAQLRVRSTEAGAPLFEEIAMTIDVSRDGILFSTTRADFHKGMFVGVTFPYAATPNAMNSEQRAEVMRVQEQGDGNFAVAVQFMHAQQRAAAAIAATGPGSKEKSTMHGASTATKGAPKQPSAARPIVLVVENDLKAQEHLKSLLTPEGYDVFAVRTGTEALDILRTTAPACFITDIEAEGTNGYDLCLIIKSSERLARVPVVLVTKSGQPSDYAASRDFGAVVCMAKPFQPERMLGVVRLVAPSPFAPAPKAPYGESKITIERVL